jgi:transcriptional regulator with XRE-family HTH domain
MNQENICKTRGLRLKEARQAANLTLKEMSRCGLINFNTLCGWELGKHGGLTERGAIKVVERLSKCGVTCSVEWLLYGIGAKPYRNETELLPKSFMSLDQWKHAHIDLLNRLYPNFLSLTVNDNTMSPEFNPKDYVCGYPTTPDLLTKASHKIIIAKLSNGEKLLRKLMIDPSGTIALITLNQEHENGCLINPSIEQFSLVMCHVKHDDLYEAINKRITHAK